MKSIFLVLLTICSFAYSSEGWFDDVAKARELAQKEQRPLLIAFLGPNWCAFSDQLELEVLLKKPFFDSMEKKVVLLRIDIPEEFEQVEFEGSNLKKQYKIEECPSLILAQPSGQEIARFEDLPLSRKDFVLSIEERITDYKRIRQLAKKKKLKTLQTDELKSLYTRAGKLADTTFKKAVLEQGLKSDRSPYFLLEQYGSLLTKGKMKDRQLLRVRNKIVARDPDNAQGCRRQLALMDFEALAHVKKSTETVIAPLVSYLKEFGAADLENAWQIEMKISRYLFSHDQVEEALKHAQASLKIAPQTARKEISQSIGYLEHLSHDKDHSKDM